MPNRHGLNAHFISAAITNPCEESIRQGIRVGDLLAGNDENCMNWIKANRKPGERSRRRRPTQ